MFSRRSKATCIVGCFALFVASAATGSGQDSQSNKTQVGAITGHAEEGKKLYERYCVGCHGAEGKGDGKDALSMGPKPRDFSKAKFECRSTPSGTLPTDEDLFNTITRGMSGTPMKPWTTLTLQQRTDLVAFIKTFSPRWKSEGPGTPIVIDSETPNTPESVERGKTLFQITLDCAKCHGKNGVGDGPSAATLDDDDGRRIKPHDFVHGGNSTFKCGGTDKDVYRSVMTGLDGTPMASWSDYIDATQAWDLIHYVRTLQHTH